MRLQSTQLRALAEVGARARIVQLEQEIHRLQRAFPALKAPGDATVRMRATAGPLLKETAHDRPATRHFTTRERAAISRRMKTYWRAKRKSNA